MIHFQPSKMRFSKIPHYVRLQFNNVYSVRPDVVSASCDQSAVTIQQCCCVKCIINHIYNITLTKKENDSTYELHMPKINCW